MRANSTARQVPGQSKRGGKVDLIDPDAHSFIVKISIDRAPAERAHPKWHGYITHVPDGERRYLKDLNDITAFIAAHLRRVGVEPDGSLLLKQRLKSWFARLGKMR